MELCEVQFAAVVAIRERPAETSVNAMIQTAIYSPDFREIVLVQTTLPEHLKCGLTSDESFATRVPSTEDLVVGFLLGLRQCPWDSRGSSATLCLVVLLERLLERDPALLLKLRRARGVIRHRGVGGEECAGHHLKARIDKACHLRHQWLHRASKPGRLRGKRAWRWAQEPILALHPEHASRLRALLLELGRNWRYRRGCSSLERAWLEACRLRLQRLESWLLLEPLLLLKPGLLHTKACRLRLLLTGKSSLLRLLEVRWTLPGEACRLRSETALLKALLLLWIVSRLHRILEALSPLCHDELGDGDEKGEEERWW